MASTAETPTETAPDPDSDDLDDLDDLLDEFDNKPKLPSEPKPSDAAPPASSGPGRPTPAPAADTTTSETAISDDEDLSQHLQAGMESLVAELGANPTMQAQFEEMMAELIAAGAAPTTSAAAEHIKRASDNMPEMPGEDVKTGAGGSGSAGAKKKDESFQDTIRKTMERVQASGDAATAASASGAEKSEDELLAEMMKQLSGGEGGGLDGLGGEEDFNSMLLSMMSQLTNKEILYEPMKELTDKFPAWMEAHAANEKAEDLGRYREQQRLVGEIVARFERSGYSDENEGDREYIVERMQKVSLSRHVQIERFMADIFGRCKHRARRRRI